MIEIRKGILSDIEKVAKIFEEIHNGEENLKTQTGWKRGVYPTKATAENALERGDLFIMLNGGEMAGTAIINKEQPYISEDAGWEFEAEDDEACVLHILAISPKHARDGLGRFFMLYYEDYAKRNGCRVLRMGVNEKNEYARKFFAKMGYRERNTVTCNLNGIDNTDIVLLEKRISSKHV